MDKYCSFLVLECHSHVFINHIKTLTSNFRVQFEKLTSQSDETRFFNGAFLVYKLETNITPLPEVLEANQLLKEEFVLS